jgi:hypothetical protein
MIMYINVVITLYKHSLVVFLQHLCMSCGLSLSLFPMQDLLWLSVCLSEGPSIFSPWLRVD